MIRVGCCSFPTSIKKYFENFSWVELNSAFHYVLQTRILDKKHCVIAIEI
ncbi:hypothetical protein KAU55_01505 [Candidatus Bathyarchaeota archaeon]|nr:hypothetical protein [Candidatus Bathyarchaeota archaeon]